MAIHTFSSKGSKPEDTEAVERIKQYCKDHNINFSGVVISLLKKWEESNERRTEV